MLQALKVRLGQFEGVSADERMHAAGDLGTGLERDESGTDHMLDAPTWQARQRRLQELLA